MQSILELIQWFWSGLSRGALGNLLDLLTFSPERLWYSMALLAWIILWNDLVRTALMTQYTRSRINHAIIDVLTLWPGFMLGFLLLAAGYRHPQRVWINLGLAAVLYVAWWAGGTLTRLARSDTEGADVGWISHGFIITMVFGVAAALVF
jgi:hypothetical protein